MKFVHAYTALFALAIAHAHPVDNPNTLGVPKYSPLDNASSVSVGAERRGKMAYYAGTRLPPQSDIAVKPEAVADEGSDTTKSANDAPMATGISVPT
ncbi:hypothetical protein B0H19DRAFT_1259776 [Mycena capillaripes]|nr:hypothetical protein B0H19DRAFT_1259776 [Mycena capillaripes]